MRFKPYGRDDGYVVTARKVAAAERSQARAAAALPLLAELVREQQPSIDQVMSDRAAAWSRSVASMRELHARCWREGRARLAALPAEWRAAALVFWNASTMPATGVYFADFTRSVARGDYQLADGKLSRPMLTGAALRAVWEANGAVVRKSTHGLGLVGHE